MKTVPSREQSTDFQLAEGRRRRTGNEMDLGPAEIEVGSFDVSQLGNRYLELA